MKVILLAPTPPPQGGIASWTERMLQAELKNGWKVTVVDEKVTGKRDAYDRNKKKYLDEAKRCIRIWKDLCVSLKDPDSKIVQACIPAETTSMCRELISAIITKMYGRKFVVHFRCTLPNMVKSKVGLLIFRRLIGVSDCVFVLNSTSERFAKHVNKNKRVKMIPNFVETSAMKEKNNYNEKLKTLTYVGGVIEDKGCDFIAALANHFPEKSFRLIGNVDMDTSLFPDNVLLLGEQPKDFVQKELDSTDAFLFLTRYRCEGFSNALAEAMSCSLPCIVSDWAANSDMIEDKGGIVLRHYKIKDAVMAIKLLESPETRRNMGKWNYNKVKKSYSDQVVLDMYVDEYEKMIKK